MKKHVTRKPWFKAFPSNFISGCIELTAEQKGVYYTLLFRMYDKWEAIDDSTLEARQFLARISGCQVRRFFTLRDELIALGKIFRDESGRLSNDRFERAKAHQGDDADEEAEISSELDGKKKGIYLPTNSQLNTPLIDPLSNENKGIGQTHARASPEARGHMPESSSSSSSLLEPDTAEKIESDLQKICRALGVDLQADTSRANWPMQLIRLKADHGLDTDRHIIPAIRTYEGRLRPDSFKSLAFFKTRALEQKQKEDLNQRLRQIGDDRHASQVETRAHVSDDQWSEMLHAFLARAKWNADDYGPTPLSLDCLVPPHLLQAFDREWKRQGEHPREQLGPSGYVPWRPGMATFYSEPRPTPARKPL